MTCYCWCSSCKFGSLLVMAFIWLLLANGSCQRKEPVVVGKVTTAMGDEFSGVFKKTTVVVGGGKVADHPEWHLNYMSKRRVPNGPDPIHNRRAGNSGRPPGKA
ncbi:hypothetical protein IC582_005881 [Cucumis melo]|uniref:Clavata3/ESR (CLE) gene family member n=2 Tax=Cucumis melo TaxID=3656 RepID=A0A1S3CMA2_CUCME|nr:Clavata3/esr-related 26, putative isoform 1 [Cucumis melo var. makuwa]TYK11343.1 Clavata3/esr-related 26, putative isoform 1 [Cucumis melo var. makuwa]